MKSKGSIGMILALSILTAVAMTPATRADGRARSPQGERSGVKQTYTGNIVGIGGALGGRTWNFTMTINGTNSQGEVAEYTQLLQSQGQDALLNAIQRRDLGTFAVTGQVGRTLNFVHKVNTDGGSRIVALFDRWESIGELRRGSRSLDYPFTYIEFSLDEKGNGSGTLIPAAKIYFDKKDPNLVNIENFGIYPLRLVNIERE
jgi:hypothetical protein